MLDSAVRARETVTMPAPPKYLRAYQGIKARIESHEWKPGDKLPSGADLCVMFRVGYSTLRTALKMLEIEGLIEGRQGDARYVTPAPE